MGPPGLQVPFFCNNITLSFWGITSQSLRAVFFVFFFSLRATLVGLSVKKHRPSLAGEWALRTSSANRILPAEPAGCHGVCPFLIMDFQPRFCELHHVVSIDLFFFFFCLNWPQFLFLQPYNTYWIMVFPFDDYWIFSAWNHKVIWLILKETPQNLNTQGCLL